MKNPVFILLIIVPAITYCQSTPQYLDQPALQGAFQIQFKGSAATGFQYSGSDNKAYLITAKHLFATKFKKTRQVGKKVSYEFYDSVTYLNGQKIEISVFYDGNWRKTNVNLYFDKKNSDVAVLKTSIPTEGNNYNFGSTGIAVSQECFFIGFPLGLRMDYSKFPGFSVYPLPFVRRGIVSGFTVSDKGFPDGFYIDGHNTYGFSGGPLLFYNYKEGKYYVAGVISGYIPQVNRDYRENGKLEISKENSGLMVVSDINFAIDILKNIGVK